MVVINRRIETHPQMLHGVDLIKEVTSFKYLGIYIDTRLKYNVQIKNLIRKWSQLCGVSIKSSKFIEFLASENMYHSCTYVYCNVLWYRSVGEGSQSTYHCSVPNRIHKKVVKNLFYFFKQSLYLLKKQELKKIIYSISWISPPVCLTFLNKGKYPALVLFFVYLTPVIIISR